MKDIKKLLVVGLFLGFLTVPNISLAALTQSQVNAIISLLQSFGANQTTISNVQSALSGETTSPVSTAWCHDFNINLKIGSSGSEIEDLQNVLIKEGFDVGSSGGNKDYFDDNVASAVSGFQQKYTDEILKPAGLKYGTGFAGKATRAKLNQLYGCGVKPPKSPIVCPEYMPPLPDFCVSGKVVYPEKDENGCFRPPKCILPPTDNQPPVIHGVGGPTTLNAGETGTWTIKAYDPENGPLTYSVIWGDTVVGMDNSILPKATTYTQTATFSHSYNAAGTYAPTFTVTDNKGLSAKTSISVNVGEISIQQPYLSISPTNLVVGNAYNFRGSLKNAPAYTGVYLQIQRPDGTLKYTDDKYMGAKYVGNTDSTGYLNITTTQTITGGQTGLYRAWVIIPGVLHGGEPNKESNIVEFNVSTQTASSINVTSPNGGEQWQLRNTHMILWKPYDPSTGLNTVSNGVSAYLEKLENGNFVKVGKIKETGKASIHWNGEIDTWGNYSAPGDYYIRVENIKTGEWDRSDAPFKLVAANTIYADLKIDNIDGPILVPIGGKDYAVTWTSNAQSCSFFDSMGGAIYNLPASGSKIIKLLPNYYSYNINASIHCVSKSPVEGNASDYVVIAPTSKTTSFINVAVPNGGESLSLETPYTIKWNRSDNINKVSIVLYRNDASYKYIVTDLPVDINPTYSWTPSSILSSSDVGSNYKIYIIGYKADGMGTLEDKSDAPFSIVATGSPTVDIKVNNSDGPIIEVKSGDKLTLTWTSSNVKSCFAMGQWYGNQALEGSAVVSALNVAVSTGTNFSLDCKTENGTTVRDSVQVNVFP